MVKYKMNAIYQLNYSFLDPSQPVALHLLHGIPGIA
jgi:hypothetical protein